MKTTVITIHYNVKRVSHYQSAEVGAAVEVEIEAGESAEEVFNKTMKMLIPIVEADADAAIQQAVYLDQQGH